MTTPAVIPSAELTAVRTRLARLVERRLLGELDLFDEHRYQRLCARERELISAE